MLYNSTRNNLLTVTSSEAVLKGIADDGGLYMFSSADEIKVDYKELIGKSFKEMATAIISKLIPDFDTDEMKVLVDKAYDGKFETEDVTPTVKVGKDYVLELFRGPTSAFKDVALSMLPQLMRASIKKNGITDKIVILTATSGDTGKAALEGFCDVEGTGIIVFFPQNGVSRIQKLQMTTQKGANTCVCGITGNFDDAQTGVKEIFSEVNGKKLLDGKGIRLSSANSINIGRLAPQVVYYFKAYSDLAESGEIKAGDKINFCVPTGNFGDILAGYLAKIMGLPVNKLICASNSNNVLTDFFKTGVYDRNREFFKTVSPSMDILISSNLERMLYLASGFNSEEIAGYMDSLKKTGKYKVSDKVFASLSEEFEAGYCSEGETKETIKNIWEECAYLCDTHTAVGMYVAKEYEKESGDETKTVILSTASPYKFSECVYSSVGGTLSDDVFETMEKLSEKTNTPVPENLAAVKTAEVRHKDCIEKEDMLSYVLNKVKEL